MRFRVVVNGKEYLVEVEEIEGEISVKSLELVESTKVEEKPQPREEKVEEKREEVEKTKEEMVQAKAPAPSAGGKVVKAPLPGKVTRVMVKPGDKVSSGDVLLYIEAMKMENEIVAPSDGEVAQVFVKPGEVVETDQPLVELR